MIQPTGPLMGYFSSTLMQITDGNAAWEEFFSGVQNAFENNAASAPKIAVVLGVIVILWLNYRLAKWLVRSSRSPKRTSKDAR